MSADLDVLRVISTVDKDTELCVFPQEYDKKQITLCQCENSESCYN